MARFQTSPAAVGGPVLWQTVSLFSGFSIIRHSDINIQVELRLFTVLRKPGMCEIFPVL